MAVCHQGAVWAQGRMAMPCARSSWARRMAWRMRWTGGKRRTKSGLRRLHQGQGELDQLSCCRASVPEASASGAAEKKRSH